MLSITLKTRSELGVFIHESGSFQRRVMLCLEPVSSVWSTKLFSGELSLKWFWWKLEEASGLRSAPVSISLAWFLESWLSGFGSYRRNSRRHTAPARARRSPLRPSGYTVPPRGSGLLLFSESLSAAPTPLLSDTSLPAHLNSDCFTSKYFHSVFLENFDSYFFNSKSLKLIKILNLFNYQKVQRMMDAFSFHLSYCYLMLLNMSAGMFQLL